MTTGIVLAWARRGSSAVLVASLAVGCADDAGGTGGDASTSGTGTTPTDDGPAMTTQMPPAESSSGADDTSTGAPATTGDTGPMGTSTGPGDSGSESGSSSDGGMPITISGVVTDFGSDEVLPGIDVCVFEDDTVDCAVTDDKGAYTLMGLTFPEGAIEFTGPGRFPSLFWGQGPADDVTLNYNLLSNIAAIVLASALDEEIDDARGHLALVALDEKGVPVSDVVFAMEPASGAQGYLDMSGIDPTLTATGEVGFVGWVNADPGIVEITATHPTLTCVPAPEAIAGASADALAIDIRAAYLGSTFPFVCS